MKIPKFLRKKSYVLGSCQNSVFIDFFLIHEEVWQPLEFIIDAHETSAN